LTPSRRDGLSARFPIRIIIEVIIASHVVITAYGFWLPNDPRGSWSDFVRNWELYRHGPAVKTKTIRKVDRSGDDGRRAMKQALRYRPVRFTGTQALWVGRAFARQVTHSGFRIYACAILPSHAHLVIARHRYPVEQVANLLKGAATRMLSEHGLHPMQNAAPRSVLPSPWASGLWKVFLDCRADVVRSIAYVNDNPVREGKKPQRWSFVTPFL
jgi:REP element-mobilizing transposase RayT